MLRTACTALGRTAWTAERTAASQENAMNLLATRKSEQNKRPDHDYLPRITAAHIHKQN